MGCSRSVETLHSFFVVTFEEENTLRFHPMDGQAEQFQRFKPFMSTFRHSVKEAGEEIGDI
jgi:hypothetical protein